MTQDEKVVRNVIENLRSRAQSLRWGALITFGLILVALAGGILLFIFAGTITSDLDQLAFGIAYTPETPSPSPSLSLSPSPTSPTYMVDHFGE
jgi:hypothetical protein